MRRQILLSRIFISGIGSHTTLNIAICNQPKGTFKGKMFNHISTVYAAPLILLKLSVQIRTLLPKAGLDDAIHAEHRLELAAPDNSIHLGTIDMSAICI